MNPKQIVAIGTVSLSTIAAIHISLIKTPPVALKSSVQAPIISKTEQVIASYSKDPYIASVIAKTKYPLTLTAIAKVESDFRPKAIGDKGMSYGMYQIQKRFHGEFGDTVEEQTDKAEEILEKLIDEQGYYEAIRAYNGSGEQSRKYRAKVIKIVKKLEKEVTWNN